MSESGAVRALRAIYAAADAEVAAAPSLFCELSARCCRFRDAGHALFVTRLEYDEMVAHGGVPPAGSDAEQVCPWLAGGLCANREGRALACRTYFCSDEEAAAEVLERRHAAVRALHDEYGIAYEYRPLHAHVNATRGFSSQ